MPKHSAASHGVPRTGRSPPDASIQMAGAWKLGKNHVKALISRGMEPRSSFL